MPVIPDLPCGKTGHYIQLHLGNELIYGLMKSFYDSLIT